MVNKIPRNIEQKQIGKKTKMAPERKPQTISLLNMCIHKQQNKGERQQKKLALNKQKGNNKQAQSKQKTTDKQAKSRQKASKKINTEWSNYANY